MGRRAPLVLIGIALAIAGATFVFLGDHYIADKAPNGAGPIRDGLTPLERSSQQNTAGLLGQAERAETAPARATAADTSDTSTMPLTLARLPAAGEARISGFVKVAARPIGGAKLTAEDSNGELLAEGTSAANGSWSLFLEPGVEFTLIATYPMTVPHSRKVPALAERAMQRAGNISLSAGRRVTGTVLDAEGRPIQGAWAAVEGQSCTKIALLRSVDATGKLLLENVPMSATIEFGAPSYEYRTIALSSDGVQDVVLFPGRSAEIFVHDPDGAPISGANVLFVRADVANGQSNMPAVRLLRGNRKPGMDSPESRHSAQTDAAGIARTSELGPGQYWAEVTHEGFRAALPTNILTAEDAALIGARFEARMERRPRIHFTIVDEHGGAPARPLATISHMEGPRLITDNCAPRDGVVDMFVAEKATYTVHAWADGFHVAQLSMESTCDRAPAPQLKLKRADRIPLFIVDSNGVLIEGAGFQVHMWTQGVASSGVDSAIRSKNTWHAQSRKQAAGGGLTVQEFAGNDWPLFSIEAPGFQSQSLPFSAWPEARIKDGVASITVQLERSASLQVTVLDKNGALVPGALIYLTANGKTGSASLSTDDFGSASSSDLSAGTISLMARGPNGELTQREEVRLSIGATTKVTLTLR